MNEKIIVVEGTLFVFSENGRVYGDLETQTDDLTEILIPHEGRKAKITIEFQD